VVVCEIETGRERNSQNSVNPSDDPTTWIPILVVDGFTTRERVLTVDKTPASAGNINFGTTGPYTPTNSSKQPFDDPLVDGTTLCQIGFVQFETSGQTLDEIIERNNKVNTSTFAGYAARTLLCNIMRAELGSYGGYPAWRVEYRFTYDPETWDEKRLDYGSLYLQSGVDPVPYMDDNNVFRIVGPLDGSGAKAATPATLIFRVKDELDFSSFIRQ
jgi:hypothetical protein